jgi:hypothetical protein
MPLRPRCARTSSTPGNVDDHRIIGIVRSQRAAANRHGFSNASLSMTVSLVTGQIEVGQRFRSAAADTSVLVRTELHAGHLR